MSIFYFYSLSALSTPYIFHDEKDKEGKNSPLTRKVSVIHHTVGSNPSKAEEEKQNGGFNLSENANNRNTFRDARHSPSVALV